MIKMFEEKYTSIWENVVILAKEGKEDTKKSFQVQKLKTKIEKATNKEVKLTKKEMERNNDEVIDFKEEIENEFKIENRHEVEVESKTLVYLKRKMNF